MSFYEGNSVAVWTTVQTKVEMETATLEVSPERIIQSELVRQYVVQGCSRGDPIEVC